jgi:hypothetical protein
MRVYNGHRPVGLREKRRETMECKWCGAETIEIAGDVWDTVCRECREEEHEQATWVAEAEETGN